MLGAILLANNPGRAGRTELSLEGSLGRFFARKTFVLEGELHGFRGADPMVGAHEAEGLHGAILPPHAFDPVNVRRGRDARRDDRRRLGWLPQRHRRS